jgi:hypothetical protein
MAEHKGPTGKTARAIPPGFGLGMLAMSREHSDGRARILTGAGARS